MLPFLRQALGTEGREEATYDSKVVIDRESRSQRLGPDLGGGDLCGAGLRRFNDVVVRLISVVDFAVADAWFGICGVS